mgnify:CR=1 FL=1
MTEQEITVNQEYVDLKINQLRNELTTNIRAAEQNNTVMNANTRVVQMGSVIDNMESRINSLKDKSIPSIEKVDEKIKDLESKMSAINDKVVPILLENTVKYIEDGVLKKLYIKCNNLTYSLVSLKLQDKNVYMSDSNISQYINDKNKNQEGRRAIHQFLTEHIKNANV